MIFIEFILEKLLNPKSLFFVEGKHLEFSKKLISNVFTDRYQKILFHLVLI